MPFNGELLIDLAYQLMNDSNKDNTDEALNRTIINRAYYGAFLLARSNTDHSTQSNQGRSIHGLVIDYFERKNKTAISNNLTNLKLLRTKADYNTYHQITYRDAFNSIRLAKKIKEAFQTTPP